MEDKHILSPEEIQEIVDRVKAQNAGMTSVATAAVKTIELPAEKEKALKAKLRQIERQKLIDSLKGYNRLDHIKSVGNGL